MNKEWQWAPGGISHLGHAFTTTIDEVEKLLARSTVKTPLVRLENTTSTDASSPKPMSLRSLWENTTSTTRHLCPVSSGTCTHVPIGFAFASTTALPWIW
ncbi:hypothetical protein Pelo_17413 [Pelomyxa schiedti]|nr:hypothetical protein Pelo_17413 [Pelomyxa schiedti]